MKTLTLTEFINRLPKVDIHYHLLGGVRMQTMLDLAEKYKEPISVREAKSYYRAYQAETGSAKGGIAALTYLYQIMKQPEDYYRVALEVAEDAHACGVKYIETFWNPSETLLEYQDVTQALAQAIDQAFNQWGIVIRLIPSINREKSPEIAVKIVQEMIQNPHPYVLGLGIDYKEHNAPVEHFWKAYRLAKNHGYKLTAHCSEFGLHWRNVESGVELLGIDRVDHGYSIIENEELTKKYRKMQIPFTVVPSNTYFFKKWPDPKEWASRHPIRVMAKAGLKIVPCTDDWHIHNTNTTLCYQIMVEQFGFDVLSLKSFLINGLEASWLPDEQKALWINQWAQSFDDAYQYLHYVPKVSRDKQIEYRHASVFRDKK